MLVLLSVKYPMQCRPGHRTYVSVSMVTCRLLHACMEHSSLAARVATGTRI